jgi:hypothetical protein
VEDIKVAKRIYKKDVVAMLKGKSMRHKPNVGTTLV